MPTTVFPVTIKVFGIDLGLLGLERYGSGYVVRGTESTALVEVGTSLAVPKILEGLEELEIAPEEVSHILLTHIHMDHAGAVGHLVEYLPNAQVVVHARSHRHLVDPARLVAGVKAAVGPLFPLYGEIRPVSPDRLVAGEDFKLDLGGGVRLEAIPTPGHAKDHLVYYAPHTCVLFTGDAAGVSLFEHSFLRPVTAPPHFDMKGTFKSIETMQAIDPASLCFTHFGARSDPRIVFDRLKETLLRWDELVRTEDLDTVQEAILAEQVPLSFAPIDDLWQHLAEMNLRGFLMAYGLEPKLD
jgi:glyoxylase-like metal-dependent hydrolase (beta-lactamase superfamily II)